MGVARTWAGALIALVLLLSSGCSSGTELYEAQPDLSVAPLGGRLILIRSDGPHLTGRIPVERSSGGVAFYNDTPDRVLSVLLPDNPLGWLHCGPTTGFVADATSTFTAQPIPPGQAATLCFHADEELPFEVHGLEGGVVRGTLVVGGSW